MTIDIAVPTHNCARWLDAFMDSVLAQDYQDWRIVVRDDGSGDNTVAHIAFWAEKLGARLLLLPNERKENLGPVGSYNLILAATTAPWVMLADPDDIWLPGKMRMSLAAMQQAEAETGAALPVIAFCDAEVIDEQGRQLSPSYWRWSRQRRRTRQRFCHVLVDSPAISSGMIVNRACLEKALPIAGSFSFQDWWLMLVATALGKVVAMPEPLFRYRRHSYNDSQTPLTSNLIGGLRNLPLAREKLESLLRFIALQAEAYYARFAPVLNAADRHALQAAIRLPLANGFERRVLILRHGLLFSSSLKNIGAFLLL